jgi:uncharacterized protein (DUF849 family)
MGAQMAGKKTSGIKVIMGCAITGSIHASTMCDVLRFKRDDIAAQAIGAAGAGASKSPTQC